MAYSIARRQEFSPSCPAGGTWWACGYGTFFVGCCARDPCEIVCAQGNLYPAAYDPRYYGKFPDLTCDQGAKFYTCGDKIGQPTFLGCCKTNPCANKSVCQDGSLEPARLNRDDQRIAYQATGGTSSMRATATSTSAASTSTGDAATSTADAKTLKDHVADKMNIPAVAGGAAGGAFALAIVIGLLIYYICHAKRSRRGHVDSVGQRMSMGGERPEKDMVGSPGPPGYYSPNPNADPNFYQHDAAYYQTHGYHSHQQYQYRPEPQELPIQPVDAGPYNPAARTHQRHPSELSGETALNSPHKPTFSAHQSPQPQEQHDPQQHGVQQHSVQQFEPQTPQRDDPQSPRSPQEEAALQSWMAHQSWRPQSTEYPQSNE